MLCLQRAVVGPLDIMHGSAEHIIGTVALYADDITIAIMGRRKEIVNASVAIMSKLAAALPSQDFAPAKPR
eukprot:6591269-Pyramimonas_sp.AAC.1